MPDWLYWLSYRRLQPAGTESLGGGYAATGVTITDAGVMSAAGNVLGVMSTACNVLVDGIVSVTGASTLEETISVTGASSLAGTSSFEGG